MSKKLDDETKALALLVLKNTFYDDFSGLVNNYLRAADGLDDDCRFEEQLHEVANLWARDDKAVSEYDLCIETSHIGDKPHQVLVCWYETMHEALSTDDALDIYIRGKRVFVMDDDGEWYYTGDDNA